ncbi:PREDICTED: fatty-acid amide hydrolase 2-like [Ceratosolen solmsi marchali]|uniref:Fatty-acid amide hydrolase 2-like n=1 Tax=Ceratosolen solmsi marchali TaxID=326594 RepID=A0AAJ6YIR4_9HYME|nr:PREDICTED: fatty-acid amide hydrolase 2-like [Ceratosolen solmsi marchali]XP_011498814.1 PREDICTED: fatty-acid amide hydrolase 2-like [Ceratosolen solmsi marchali]XP_011498815.1 PREDICTED: fatty-acid amide hydrolase 2-like [Ceratosolen solmsi marchali]
MLSTLKTIFLEVTKIVLIQLHLLIDVLVEFFFGLYYDKRIQKVPPVKNNLLLQSTIQIARNIREKKISSEEVVKTFIERCKEVNGLLNAIVEERYEDAIKQAKEVDNFLNSENYNITELEKTKPLLGVPFTTKESNEAKGLLHSMGTLRRKGHRSLEDATVIKNVKTAGAIIIGKTNIPELNQWVECRNKIYGQTNNPYNTTRTVGGSSGGDAAIVSACGVPFAVGSDIGGSIRIPASYNGIYGLKPSQGMTSLKGIGMRQEEHLDSMAEAGPLCKRAEDLELLMTIMSGSLLNKPLNTPINLKNINVFYQESSGDIRASELSFETKNALKKATKYLEELCGSVTKMTLPGTEYSYRLWRYWMTQEKINFKENLTNNTGCTNFKIEFCKILSGNCEITFAALLKLFDSDVFPKENEEWAKSMTNLMKTSLLAKLGDNGIFIYPSFNSAKYHCALFLSPFSFGYWAVFNVLKVPVCQIPMGLDKNGLPIGIQIVAAPNNDHLCIAVAKELEKEFKWIEP